MKATFQKSSNRFDQNCKPEKKLKNISTNKVCSASGNYLLQLQDNSRILMRRPSEPANHAKKNFWQKHRLFNIWLLKVPLGATRMKNVTVLLLKSFPGTGGGNLSDQKEVFVWFNKSQQKVRVWEILKFEDLMLYFFANNAWHCNTRWGQMVSKQCGVWYENCTKKGEKKFCNNSRQENCADEIEFHFFSRTLQLRNFSVC